MKKERFVLSMAALSLMAMNVYSETETSYHYDITFGARGDTTVVEQVKVENLTRGTELEVSGADIVRLCPKLSEDTGIEIAEPILYPNPVYKDSKLVFDTKEAGEVMIRILDISGKEVQKASFRLGIGRYAFELPGMDAGTSIVQVTGCGIQSAIRWLSLNTSGGSGTIRIAASEEAETSMSFVDTPFYEQATRTTPLLPVQSVINTAASERISNVKVQEMEFSKGDLLRFTGTCGNMRTMVMNSPTVSHDIIFDLYDCTDNAGNHYAVVRAGGMLWMAEDLKYVGAPVVLMKSSAVWAQYNIEKPMAAYYNFDAAHAQEGAYYNYVGAKTAMPKGWNLPTAGEMDYMMQQMGGYENAAARLKAHGDESRWLSPSTDLDSISFGAQPNGYLDMEGNFVHYDISTWYYTRSTKDKKPIYFEMTDGENALKMDINNTIPNERTGYHVRGCRPAPTAYAQMIEHFGDTPDKVAPKRAADANAYIQNGPLGAKYELKEEESKLFFNLSSSQAGNQGTKLMECVDGWSNKSISNDNYYDLKKCAGQNNANNRQNLVVATFTGSVFGGEGQIILHVYGDATQNYEKLQTVTLPETFTLHSVGGKRGFEISNDMLDNGEAYNTFSQVFFYQYEQISRNFQIICADFNDDGIDDVVLCLSSWVYIYDGTDYTTELARKYFPSNYIRLAAGAVNEDRLPALAVQYYTGDFDKVEIFKDIKDLSTPDYFYTLPTGEFHDIKMGDIDGDGLNNILCFTRDYWGSAGPRLTVLEYDAASQGGLKKEYEMNMPKSWWMRGNDIALCRYRGTGYPQDIVVYNSVIRFNEGTLNTVFTYDHPYIPADNMIGGEFHNVGTGLEETIFLSQDYAKADRSWANDAYPLFRTAVRSIWYDVSAGQFRSSQIFAPINTGFANLYGGGGYKYQSYKEERVGFPMLGCARSEKASRVLRYVSHTQSMSDPRIYAVLAAAPYFKDYEYKSDRGTSWGASSFTGGGTSTSSSNSVSGIIGYEHDFTIPIISQKVGSVDFTTKLQWEWTHSTETEWTVTQSNEFTTKEQDAVVLTTTPFYTYNYEIVKSENPDEIGTLMSLSIPGYSRTMMMTLPDYQWLRGDDPSIPDLRKLFTHTVGEPFTYPNSVESIQSNVKNSTILWGGTLEGQGDGFLSTGSGGTLSRKIELTSSTAQSAGFTFNLDLELVATYYGVKLGAGYGHSNTNTSTHTEGEGHSITGAVASPTTITDLPQFKWNVCWYKYCLDKQTFPVINYVVIK